jgi:hypothetical protein
MQPPASGASSEDAPSAANALPQQIPRPPWGITVLAPATLPRDIAPVTSKAGKSGRGQTKGGGYRLAL